MQTIIRVLARSETGKDSFVCSHEFPSDLSKNAGKAKNGGSDIGFRSSQMRFAVQKNHSKNFFFAELKNDGLQKY
jgi:hypothetical protein